MSDMARVAKEINKQYKRTVICRACDAKIQLVRCPSGSFSFDVESGGGVTVARILEYYGNYSCAKTTFALHNVAEFQNKFENKDVLWLDSSSTFDTPWAEKNSVDTSRLDLSQVRKMESIIDMVSAASESNAYSLIVIDDVASCIPGKVLETEGDSSFGMGLHARFTNRLLHVFLAATEPENLDREEDRNLTTLLLLNQERSTMDQWSPTTTTGGRGKEFYCSIRAEFRRGDWIKEGKGENKQVVGQQVKVTIHKNKTYKRERRLLFDFYFEDSEQFGFRAGEIDRKTEVINYALLWKIITRRGAYFDLGNSGYSVHGKKELFDLLEKQPSLYKMIENRVFEKINEVDSQVHKIEKDEVVEKALLGKTEETEDDEMVILNEEGKVETNDESKPKESVVTEFLSSWDDDEEESGEGGEEISEEDTRKES